MCDTTKAILREKFKHWTAVLEKEEQMKSKKSQRKEMINIKVEINETTFEKKHLRKWLKAKPASLKSVKLMKLWRRQCENTCDQELQIPNRNVRNERDYITRDSTDIKKDNKGILWTTTFDNLEEIPW